MRTENGITARITVSILCKGKRPCPALPESAIVGTGSRTVLGNRTWAVGRAGLVALVCAEVRRRASRVVIDVRNPLAGVHGLAFRPKKDVD